MTRLQTLLEHPVMDIAIAVILIITSIAEGWETLVDDLVKFDAGVHHGVLIFGFLQLLRAIPDVIEGAKRVAKAKA